MSDTKICRIMGCAQVTSAPPVSLKARCGIGSGPSAMAQKPSKSEPLWATLGHPFLLTVFGLSGRTVSRTMPVSNQALKVASEMAQKGKKSCHLLPFTATFWHTRSTPPRGSSPSVACLYDRASHARCRVEMWAHLCRRRCSTVRPARSRGEHGYRAYVARFKRRV
jgi:hypothetical protein